MGSHTFFTALIVATLALSQLDSCLAIQCYQCNSTVSEACLTAPAEEVACTRDCFTSSDGGTIARGCLAENVTCVAPKCNSCNGDKCNTNLFCYQCTGESCNTPANNTLAACGLADAKCYTSGTSANAMLRGCTSDEGAKCPAGSTDASCATCNTTACNNVQYERDAGNCSQCSNCPGAQEASSATSCGKLLYNQASLGCYTINNGTVYRGCVTAEQTCSTENSCTTCSEAACNLGAEEFQCAVCSTLTNDKCQKGADAPVTACPDKCFYGHWSGAGIRGCWDQASELMQYQCQNEKSHNCTICATSLCNIEAFSGAASRKQLGVGLLLGLILTLRCAL
ncbi:variant-specific surface protein VSP4A1 [Drosophila obscura]|uniref:variant-specific surface protein VSP4A1 n=1 Tax=Drosophila obscura TaxID=7282 RepID=UPI001BB18D90|nr:variant-specific surface protein VSP4A1 [Drosophila obscura]